MNFINSCCKRNSIVKLHGKNRPLRVAPWGRMDRYDEANGRFSQRCERA